MALFKDMLKKWFYTQGTSPTLSPTSRVPILDGSGNPVGSSSSVNLSDYFTSLFTGSHQISSGTDLNSLTRGIYSSPSQTVSQTISNLPESVGLWAGFWLIHIEYTANYGVQIILASKGIFARARKGESSYSQWVNIASFT